MDTLKEIRQQLTKAIEERSALLAQSNNSNDLEELKALNDKIRAKTCDIVILRGDLMAGRQRNSDERTDAINSSMECRAESPRFVQGKGFTPAERRGVDYSKTLETRDKAGMDLKEKRSVPSPFGIFGELRAVTIGDGTDIVVPQTFSPAINNDFNAVSSLIDNVAHLSLNGGESFRQPYIKGIDVGTYTAEGADSSDAETHFDYVDITKAKITAYAELTEELFKLPNAAYADTVFQNIRNLMRLLLTKEILLGTGNTNQMVGIFSDKATPIDSDTDLAMSAIDDTTLDTIIYSYGGDEDVESPAVLILNKADLLAFAKVRTSTTLRYYDIQTNGNTGTINGVPFIINSACKQLSAASTDNGAYCMAYGNLSSYQLVEFSPMEVKVSDDFRFRQGMSAYRGVAFFGGNVVKKNGFLRIKKG